MKTLIYLLSRVIPRVVVISAYDALNTVKNKAFRYSAFLQIFDKALTALI